LQENAKVNQQTIILAINLSMKWSMYLLHKRYYKRSGNKTQYYSNRCSGHHCHNSCNDTFFSSFEVRFGMVFIYSSLY